MKGYEQVGGVDFVVDIDVDEEDGDADGAEEGQENNDEEAPKDGMNDDLIDDDLAIDELDKANLTTKEKATGSANRTKSSAFSNALCSDSNHENFIMECVVSAKQLSHVSPPVEMLDISNPCLKDICHASPYEMETVIDNGTNIDVDGGVSTPKLTDMRNVSGGEKTENMKYCEDLLNLLTWLSLMRKNVMVLMKSWRFSLPRLSKLYNLMA